MVVIMRKTVVSVSKSPIRPMGLFILALALCARSASAGEPASFYQGKSIRGSVKTCV